MINSKKKKLLKWKCKCKFDLFDTKIVQLVDKIVLNSLVIMAYESTPPRVKTRSASISAPTSGSLETILNPPSSNGTPEIGYQRRRPATRTQSARITGARSV